jgi:hypothetical protein
MNNNRGIGNVENQDLEETRHPQHGNQSSTHTNDERDHQKHSDSQQEQQLHTRSLDKTDTTTTPTTHTQDSTIRTQEAQPQHNMTDGIRREESSKAQAEQHENITKRQYIQQTLPQYDNTPNRNNDAWGG